LNFNKPLGVKLFSFLPAMLDSLCKHGEVDAANEPLLEMSEEGLQPNVCTYNALINGLIFLYF